MGAKDATDEITSSGGMGEGWEVLGDFVKSQFSDSGFKRSHPDAFFRCCNYSKKSRFNS